MLTSCQTGHTFHALTQPADRPCGFLWENLCGRLSTGQLTITHLGRSTLQRTRRWLRTEQASSRSTDSCPSYICCSP